MTLRSNTAAGRSGLIRYAARRALQGWSMHLQNGWTWDSHRGAICHFRHHPRVDAERKAQLREECFVFETANWTYADGDRSACHLNAYFAIDMPSTIALAARMEIAVLDTRRVRLPRGRSGAAIGWTA